MALELWPAAAATAQFSVITSQRASSNQKPLEGAARPKVCCDTRGIQMLLLRSLVQRDAMPARARDCLPSAASSAVPGRQGVGAAVTRVPMQHCHCKQHSAQHCWLRSARGSAVGESHSDVPSKAVCLSIAAGSACQRACEALSGSRLARFGA